MGIIKVNKRVQRQTSTLTDDDDLLLKPGTEASDGAASVALKGALTLVRLNY